MRPGALRSAVSWLRLGGGSFKAQCQQTLGAFLTAPGQPQLHRSLGIAAAVAKLPGRGRAILLSRARATSCLSRSAPGPARCRDCLWDCLLHAAMASDPKIAFPWQRLSVIVPALVSARKQPSKRGPPRGITVLIGPLAGLPVQNEEPNIGDTIDRWGHAAKLALLAGRQKCKLPSPCLSLELPAAGSTRAAPPPPPS